MEPLRGTRTEMHDSRESAFYSQEAGGCLGSDPVLFWPWLSIYTPVSG